MRNARLFEFGVIFIALAILLISIIVAIKVSVLVGALLLVGLTIGVLWLTYNRDAWIVDKLTSDDDPLILNLCMTGFVGRVRSVTRILPASPRCKFCLVPFGGVGRLIGIQPSKKNPNFCRSCFAALPSATLDMEVGIMFADCRGFTAWSETHQPGEVTDVLTRFYEIAAEEITRDDALVEYIGDQVMAMYLTKFPSLQERTCDMMYEAAKRLITRLKSEKLPLKVGVGMNYGMANVGTIQTGLTKDFKAIGDTVNVAARLQAQAGPWEVVFSESFAEHLRQPGGEAKPVTFTVKGKVDPLSAFVLQI